MQAGCRMSSADSETLEGSWRPEETEWNATEASYGVLKQGGQHCSMDALPDSPPAHDPLTGCR